MKLLRADIASFGKFYHRSFFFQDGIHVISGPNEAGKSTLHAFIGAMLFGLERGRGKAARTAPYSRYLPWEHDGVYGGRLSFESDEITFTVERSLRSDKKACYLTREEGGQLPCSDGKLPDEILEGMTEAIFQNTISIRQLQAAPDASLAEQLALCFSDVRQTGDPSIRCDRALTRLRAEKRQKEALLEPDLDSAAIRLKEEKLRLEQFLSDTSFRGRKEQLENEIDDCLDRLDQAESQSGETERDVHGEGQEIARPSVGPRLSGIALSLFFLAAAAFLFANNLPLPAAGTGLAAAAVLLWTVLHRRRDGDSLAAKKTGGSSSGVGARQQIKLQQRRETLRLRLKECRRLYQEASRQEWDWEQALEKLQNTEEELSALEEKIAAQDDIRLDIQAISLAIATLSRLAGQQTSKLGPRLDSSLSRILSGLTGGAYRSLSIDDSLNLSVCTADRTVAASALSQGTLEQIWLALRLAAVDVIFPRGGMPLLLDDCFLTYDDDRLAHTLRWLAENYSGQIFIFTCQKREADLLRREQIPFTSILL